ncbi:hypothetical protein ABID21_000343 [Pseudorhizobium tarimense]|uniref:Lectin-like protein BA14k n=1 Tax=Pseudorhizobium tarimense TaxID=1079109 RepID=A0ABV2H136_9HYPH|nr:BA14K family protein [Pseudorhizobium tarimense]MCJ8517572.1 BA14K family protein [Pseudorhizobium tarimense]
MRAFSSRFTTMAAAFAIAVSSFVPVQAMPLPSAPTAAAHTTVTDVQYRDRGDRRWDRRDDRRHYRRGYRAGYHNGYRGYRNRRPGYRYYNGFWFPLAAFASGAIIGGSSSQARPSRSLSARHYQWCENRYRSYRASDNTYQPYEGPRRQCYSPYS